MEKLRANSHTQLRTATLVTTTSSMSDNEETRRLWRIRKTTLQMLRDRNYLVSVSELDLNFAAFSERFGVPARRPAMTFSAPKKDDPTDQIIIFFAQEAKIGVKELRDYISHMVGIDLPRIFLTPLF